MSYKATADSRVLQGLNVAEGETCSVALSQLNSCRNLHLIDCRLQVAEPVQGAPGGGGGEIIERAVERLNDASGGTGGLVDP